MSSQQNRRITIRLTPHQASLLWKLRTDGRLGTETEPASVTEVLLQGLASLETFGTAKPDVLKAPRSRVPGLLEDGSLDPESPLNRLI